MQIYAQMYASPRAWAIPPPARRPPSAMQEQNKWRPQKWHPGCTSGEEAVFDHARHVWAHPTILRGSHVTSTSPRLIWRLVRWQEAASGHDQRLRAPSPAQTQPQPQQPQPQPGPQPQQQQQQLQPQPQQQQARQTGAGTYISSINQQ